MAKLGEVCIQITDGSHNPPSGVEQSEYLMLSSKNIDDDFITLDSPRFLSHSDYIAENKRTTVSEGDLLMTIVGTIGRVAIVPEELKGICLQRSVAVIKPEQKVVNNRYLMYQLQNMRPFLEKEARGVAQKGIYLKQVSQLDIKLPELEHQVQIVKVLDKASKLIFLRRQQLAKLDELVKARFVEMFETRKYPIEKLGRVCEKITDGTHKTPTYLDSGIKFISAKNIIDGKVDLTDTKYISKNEYQEIQKRCQVEIQDILLTKSGTLGIPAIIRTDCALGLFESLAVIKYDRSKLLPYFLYEQLRCNRVQRQFKDGTKGVAVKHLHLGVISDIDIIVPPISYQLEFSDFAEQVDKQKQTVQQSLEKLELMKKALMQEYFG